MWEGYYIEPGSDNQHPTSLRLDFFAGQLKGAGCDLVGAYQVMGGYRRSDGYCFWDKNYIGKHTIRYQGHAKGGIAGRWDLGGGWGGPFELWPVEPS